MVKQYQSTVRDLSNSPSKHFFFEPCLASLSWRSPPVFWFKFGILQVFIHLTMFVGWLYHLCWCLKPQLGCSTHMSIMSVDLTPFGWRNQCFFVQNPHARLAIVNCSVVQFQFLGGKQSNVWCEPVTPIFVRYFCPTHINSFGAYNHILSGKHIHLGLFENGVPQIPEDYIFSLFQFRIGKLRFYFYYLYPTQINYSLALAKCLFLSLRSHFREGNGQI